MADTQAYPLRFRRRLGAIVVGLAIFHVGLHLSDNPGTLWAIAAGAGVVLVAWHGAGLAGVLAVDIFCYRYLLAERSLQASLAGAIILPTMFVVSWWSYRKLVQGVRELDEPRSAIAFLLLVPGLWCGLAAAGLTLGEARTAGPLGYEVLAQWLRLALGVLALAPPLLVILTRLLVQHGIIADEPTKLRSTRDRLADWTLAEVVETAGLTLGTAVLSGLMAVLQLRQPGQTWHLWGMAMIVIVWAGLRQGLRASSLSAGVAALTALAVSGSAAGSQAAWELRGALLAQCSTALLVGAALGWVSASESRYRQALRHIPLVLYSVRIPRLLVARLFRGLAHNSLAQGREKKQLLPALTDAAELVLVSPASKQILGIDADELHGPYRNWLERIHDADKEMLLAALAQLCMQRSPVTCEYRLAKRDLDLATEAPQMLFSPDGIFRQVERERWVRDTLAPHFDPDGLLDGWDGVVEDITQQRALSLDLRRTTSMLNALLTNLPTGIYFVHGPLGKPVLVNSRAKQLLGQRDDVAAGVDHLPQVYRLHRPDGSLYAAEDLPVVRALREGRTCTADDIVVHRADGRQIPLITWAAPIDLEKKDSPDAAVWVLEDLNTVKKAQLAREQMQNRLRAIIETMAEGIVVQDETGKILECNPAACSILRCSSAELLERFALAECCLREDGSAFPREDQPDRVALRGGQPVREVIMGIHAEPAPRWLLLNATLLAPGWPDFRPRIVTTFSDITDARQALESVRQSKEKYQRLLESLPLVVLQIAPGGRIDYVNPAAQQLLGIDLAQLAVPGSWRSRVHPEDQEQVDKAMSHALAGYHSRLEFRYRAGDDSERHLYALLQPGAVGVPPLPPPSPLIPLAQEERGTSSSALPAGEREGTGCTCIVVDMTLQRHLERELQRAQRLEIVGRLAGGTVHDLNNLITVMMGLAGLAQTQLADDHPLRNDLNHIMDVGEQASHLAGQLLTFGKRGRDSFRVIELNSATRQAVKILKSALPMNVALNVEVADRALPIQADETQLKQLILNLGLNARDAMPRGGALTFRTLNADPSGAILRIEDTGDGMDEAVRRRLFEPFFTTKERGSGLGLVVVRQIVDNFGGRISVTSEANKGTCFEIWLPLASQSPVPPR